VKNWIDGVEGTSMVGLSARFGTSVPTNEDEAHRMTVVETNPLNCCENSSTQVC
jgi:signal peptide peptidase-like protein 2B